MMSQEEEPIITLENYTRSDTEVLVEATFSANPIYWATIYNKPEDRGPTKDVSGSFSI
jgi:hypothetical protein